MLKPVPFFQKAFGFLLGHDWDIIPDCGIADDQVN